MRLSAFRSRNPASRRVHLATETGSLSRMFALCEVRRPWCSGDIRPTDYLCPACAAESKRLGLKYEHPILRAKMGT